MVVVVQEEELESKFVGKVPEEVEGQVQDR